MHGLGKFRFLVFPIYDQLDLWQRCDQMQHTQYQHIIHEKYNMKDNTPAKHETLLTIWNATQYQQPIRAKYNIKGNTPVHMKHGLSSEMRHVDSSMFKIPIHHLRKAWMVVLGRSQM
jgi:hypothetical protein